MKRHTDKNGWRGKKRTSWKYTSRTLEGELGSDVQNDRGVYQGSPISALFI